MNLKNPFTTLIWDLSGTLLKTNCRDEKEVQQDHLSLLLYLWGGKKNLSIYDKKALTLLDTFGSQQSSPSETIRFPDGSQVPLLICQWLAGSMTSSQITEHALNALQNARLPAHEQSAIAHILIAAFDPEKIAACMHIMDSAFRLFKHCLDVGQTNTYSLSNWDKQSFEFVYSSKQLQPLFSLLPRNHILISADAHAIKPQKKIYELLFASYKLDPTTCLFIDNQKENLEAAESFGVNTILFQDDYELMFNRLQEIGILS